MLTQNTLSFYQMDATFTFSPTNYCMLCSKYIYFLFVNVASDSHIILHHIYKMSFRETYQITMYCICICILLSINIIMTKMVKLHVNYIKNCYIRHKKESGLYQT